QISANPPWSDNLFFVRHCLYNLSSIVKPQSHI
ncbi:hypothetical protein GCK32_015709, partial [Trichostrongylus colubriformis]